MPSAEALFNHVMTKYRSTVVLLLALPLSLVWDLVVFLRLRMITYLRSAPSQHAQRVRRIAEQVRNRPAGTPICTGRPGWMSMSLSYRNYKKSMHRIEMPLIDIVSMDLNGAQPTVTVEPFVSMGQLSHALLPLGFALPIVPEMDDLTVGGLVNGTGIESSSHRHGLFHEICVAFELCLGDGTVLVASAAEHSDLFKAVPWSYGTLGLLLSATIKVQRVKPWVRLEYTPFTERAAALAHFGALSEAGAAAPEFVEGLVYSEDEAVIMAGEGADAPAADGAVNSFSWWFKPWFFKHVEKMVRGPNNNDASAATVAGAAGATRVEYVPRRDYYHRHTRSMFWEMELMLPVGNHPLFRYPLGWMMPPKVSFLKITQTELTRRLTEETHVAQDFLLPLAKLGDLLDVCHTVLDRVYPVWLCPHKHSDMAGSLLRGPVGAPAAPLAADGTQMWVDVGVYGLPRAVHEQKPFDMRGAMRCVEAKLRGMGGVQMLYADIFHSKEEFEQMFEHEAYRALRDKYKAAGAFPEVFAKMHSLY